MAASDINRKTHWERVYSEKSVDQVSWFQPEPSQSLELIESTGVSRSAPIIDVGAGASVLVDYLLMRGYTDVSVLDIASNALELSKARLGKRSQAVQWWVSDVTDFRPDRRFMLWHDRAVFHFLTDPFLREKYRETLLRVLKPGGHLIIGTFALDGPLKCSGLEIVQYDSPKLLAELGPEFSLRDEQHEEHVTPAGSVQNFSWFILDFLGALN